MKRKRPIIELAEKASAAEHTVVMTSSSSQSDASTISVQDGNPRAGRQKYIYTYILQLSSNKVILYIT